MLHVFQHGGHVGALDADSNGGFAALAGRGHGFGPIQTLLLRERGPLARDLRPDDSMHSTPVEEFDLRRQALEVQLIGVGER
jgi:hypothetical protein